MNNPFGFDSTSLSREVSVSFPGMSGPLEGLWRPPAPNQKPRGVVVVAHPHPAYQGTMQSKVVFHLARVLNHDFEFASLRFNFRGVGNSAGRYDEGRGEINDVLAAWHEARRRVPGGPLVASGFSFGSAMTLFAAAKETVDQLHPSAFALLGLPLGLFDPPAPFPLEVPLAAAHGENDQFTRPGRVLEYLKLWPASWAFRMETHGDHFLTGRLPGALHFLSRSLSQFMACSEAFKRSE